MSPEGDQPSVSGTEAAGEGPPLPAAPAQPTAADLKAAEKARKAAEMARNEAVAGLKKLLVENPMWIPVQHRGAVNQLLAQL